MTPFCSIRKISCYRDKAIVERPVVQLLKDPVGGGLYDPG